MSVSDKIKLLRKELNLTQAALSRILEVSSGNISDWESERAKPSMNAFINFTTKLNISLNCLLIGEGNIFNNDFDDAPLTKGESLSLDEKILLNNYRTMSNYKKEELQNVTIELIKDIDVNNDEDILLEDFRDMSAEGQEKNIYFKKYGRRRRSYKRR